MATVGLVGGLGPESTIDYYRYYRRILESWRPALDTTALHVAAIVERLRT
jgi:aspartate/glutamate racemase